MSHTPTIHIYTESRKRLYLAGEDMLAALLDLSAAGILSPRVTDSALCKAARTKARAAIGKATKRPDGADQDTDDFFAGYDVPGFPKDEGKP